MALALTCGAFAYGVWTVALVWEVIPLGGVRPSSPSLDRRAVGVPLPRSWPAWSPTGSPQKLVVMTVAIAEVVGYTGDRGAVAV